MKFPGVAKKLLLVALVLLVLSVIFAVTSLFPVNQSADQSAVASKNTLINDTLLLSPNETYREGLGSFHGGEKISLSIECPTAFPINFSIITYSGLQYSNSSPSNITYSFIAGADYYEAVFFSDALTDGTVHFQISIQEPTILFPYSWLTEPSKIMFLISISLVVLIMPKIVFSNFPNFPNFKFEKLISPSVREKSHRCLLILILLSLTFWILILTINANPLATFENWYTDHARHSYVSTLFLKDGFSVFNTPLGKLSDFDNSYYKFVTWPEMPHLYPLGSIFLFLPFGVLLQNGFDVILVFKIEIALFLISAHVCLYFFLRSFIKKDIVWILKAVGIYIIYVTLVIYAANGMFDSIAFLFSLLALPMFMSERYDYFLLLLAISTFFKYQAGIFLFPLIIIGLVMLLKKNKLSNLWKNKAVVAGAALGTISAFTSTLSAPYFLAAGPKLIMNGINAFSPNAQIPWSLQSFATLLTLVATVTYAVYMLNKNSLLSFVALFMLLPGFMLPYFQNWYLPFVFIYVLIPQQKKELEVTVVWLVFMITVLSFGGLSFNPMPILDNLKGLIRL
jgi:hypothetical protein